MESEAVEVEADVEVQEEVLQAHVWGFGVFICLKMSSERALRRLDLRCRRRYLSQGRPALATMCLPPTDSGIRREAVKGSTVDPLRECGLLLLGGPHWRVDFRSQCEHNAKGREDAAGVKQVNPLFAPSSDISHGHESS